MREAEEMRRKAWRHRTGRHRWAVRMVALAALAAGLVLFPGSTSAATIQVDVQGEIVIETFGISLPNDPNRCVAVTFVEFAPIPGAATYTAVVANNRLNGLHQTFSTSPPYAADHYTISFGGGITHTFDAPGGSHRIGPLGSYSTGAGCSEASSVASGGFSLVSLTTQVTNEPPTANFTWQARAGDSLTIDFDASSSTDDTGIASYAWDFGDDQTGSGQTTSHTYDGAGTFPVKLMVTDSEGETDSKTLDVDVERCSGGALSAFSAFRLSRAAQQESRFLFTVTNSQGHGVRNVKIEVKEGCSGKTFVSAPTGVAGRVTIQIQHDPDPKFTITPLPEGHFSPGFVTRGGATDGTAEIDFTAADTCFGQPVTVLGTDDAETLNAASDDVVVALGGNDTVRSASDASSVFACGNDGIDHLVGANGRDFFDGGAGSDELEGGFGRDQLEGGDDNDILNAGSGCDLVRGGAGDDHIDGGEVADAASGDCSGGLYGDAGNDTIGGGPGADEIHGGDGDDLVDGDSGGDTISGDGGCDGLVGNDGSDTINGGDGADAPASVPGGCEFGGISGGSGQDTLRGGSGQDAIYGQDGRDTIDGGPDADTVFGGDGNDLITGGDEAFQACGNGADRIFGENGADTIDAGAGGDFVDGGDGSDTINGDGDCDVLHGGDGRDRIDGGANDAGPVHELVAGEDGNDTLLGGLGDDQILGGADNDSINGGEGDDVIDGGNGGDTIRGDAGDDLIKGGPGGDRLEGDNTLAGGSGNDRIGGGEGNDSIDGGPGNDVLYGAADKDQISGGPGADQLDGGVTGLTRPLNPNDNDFVPADEPSFGILGLPRPTPEDTLDGGADRDTCANRGDRLLPTCETKQNIGGNHVMTPAFLELVGP